MYMCIINLCWGRNMCVGWVGLMWVCWGLKLHVRTLYSTAEQLTTALLLLLRWLLVSEPQFEDVHVCLSFPPSVGGGTSPYSLTHPLWSPWQPISPALPLFSPSNSLTQIYKALSSVLMLTHSCTRMHTLPPEHGSETAVGD